MKVVVHRNKRARQANYWYRHEKGVGIWRQFNCKHIREKKVFDLSVQQTRSYEAVYIYIRRQVLSRIE
jgi:hypothetical protein